MKKLFTLALFLLALLLPIGVSAQSFSHIFVFGDSLSDPGNLAAAIAPDPLPLPPAHSNGGRRFSNGPLAVEVLADTLGLHADPFLIIPGGTNFAFASARAGGDENIDLFAQMDTFFSIHADAEGTIPPDALYLIIIGTNDVRDASKRGDDHLAKGMIKRAVRRIDQSISTLVAAGAKTILVGNATDVSLLPETAIIAASGDLNIAERATRLSKQFNRRLAKRVNRHSHQGDHGGRNGVNIVLFDIFSFFRFIVNNHLPLGFTNTEEACFNSGALAFNPACLSGDPGAPTFERFIFFDWFHPTAGVHAIVGQGLFSAIPLLVGDIP
ncbi:MAG: SGNH/GDSL hydrolase family protein [bacterium]